jgi:hypothetical protein
MSGWIPNWGWSSADLVRILPGDQYLDNPELTVSKHHAHGVDLPACQFWRRLTAAPLAPVIGTRPSDRRL